MGCKCRFNVGYGGYQLFRQLEGFTGGKNLISEKDFKAVFNKKPGKGKPDPDKKPEKNTEWTDQEKKEFENEVKEGKHIFNY